MSIIDWVENGEVPEIVRGTKSVNNTLALSIAFSRKYCTHLKLNKYIGNRNGTDEERWHCVDAKLIY